jgi:histidinol-phosphate aminotransferase
VRHPYNISATTLAIAETLLTRFADEQRALVDHARRSRDRLRAILSGLDRAEVFPSGANFVLVRLTPHARATELCGHLEREGVLVKDLSAKPALAGCLRVSLGTETDLDRLESALASSPP